MLADEKKATGKAEWIYDSGNTKAVGQIMNDCNGKMEKIKVKKRNC